MNGKRHPHTPSPLRGTLPALGGESAARTAPARRKPLRNTSPKIGEVDAKRTEEHERQHSWNNIDKKKD